MYNKHSCKSPSHDARLDDNIELPAMIKISYNGWAKKTEQILHLSCKSSTP